MQPRYSMSSQPSSGIHTSRDAGKERHHPRHNLLKIPNKARVQRVCEMLGTTMFFDARWEFLQALLVDTNIHKVVERCHAIFTRRVRKLPTEPTERMIPLEGF